MTMKEAVCIVVLALIATAGFFVSLYFGMEAESMEQLNASTWGTFLSLGIGGFVTRWCYRIQVRS